MEMCDRKYTHGDKSTFGQSMPKKGWQKRIFFCTLKVGQ